MKYFVYTSGTRQEIKLDQYLFACFVHILGAQHTHMLQTLYKGKYQHRRGNRLLFQPAMKTTDMM